MNTQQVAIHKDKYCDKVVEFIDLNKFTDEFQREYDKGFIYGVYYDDYGDLVAQLNGGDNELNDILK